MSNEITRIIYRFEWNISRSKIICWDYFERSVFLI